MPAPRRTFYQRGIGVLNPLAVPGAYRSSRAHDSLMVCSQVGFGNEMKSCAALSASRSPSNDIYRQTSTRGRVHALEGRPVYLTAHLVSSLIRRDEEKWYGDIGLLGEQIAHPQYS